MRVLVTGADGFLGSHITETLLADGHDVTALHHPASAQNTFEDDDRIRVVTGDILDPSTLAPALKGIDAVIHAAANTSIHPRRQKAVWDINLTGTQNMVAAAGNEGVRRFVCIGTANSFGRGSLDQPGDETCPYTDAIYRTDYMDSKKAVQDWLMNHVAETGFPALMINPCFMLGPGDRKPGSGVMMLRLHGRKILPISTGGRNFVDVRDVARAAVNSLEKGRIGECYICGNENIPYTRIFPLFGKIMGMDKAVPMRFPRFLTLGYGVLNSFVCWFTGKEPEISILIARVSFGGFYYSVEKARRELDLPASPVEQAAREGLSLVL